MTKRFLQNDRSNKSHRKNPHSRCERKNFLEIHSSKQNFKRNCSTHRETKERKEEPAATTEHPSAPADNNFPFLLLLRLLPVYYQNAPRTTITDTISSRTATGRLLLLLQLLFALLLHHTTDIFLSKMEKMRQHSQQKEGYKNENDEQLPSESRPRRAETKRK